MDYEWAVRTLPARPRWKPERELRKLSKRELAFRCWAAGVNADESMQSASEAWARCAELVEMIEGKQPVSQALIDKLNGHRAHVEECRRGACEHGYAALVRADLVARPPLTPPTGR